MSYSLTLKRSGSRAARGPGQPGSVGAQESSRVALIGPPTQRDPLNLNPPVYDGELEIAIASGATDLIVDLREEPVGSLALNALLRARQQLANRGRVALVASPRLRRFCQASGLDRRFVLAKDHKQALRLLRLHRRLRGGFGQPQWSSLNRGRKHAALSAPAGEGLAHAWFEVPRPRLASR